MKKHLATLSLALMMQTACSDNVVQKIEEPNIHTTSYAVSASACEIVWEVQRAPEFPKGFSFSEKSQCTSPLAEQKALRLALLDSLIADTNNFADVRGFGWAQIRRGDATEVFAQRMQQLAKESNWLALIVRKKNANPYLFLKR